MTLSTILIGILPSVFFGVATTLMGKTGGSDRQRVMGAVLGACSWPQSPPPSCTPRGRR